MTEAWKPVKGYEGLYEISDLGRIKSFKKYPQGKILTPSTDTDGYFRIPLRYNNTQTCGRLISRLAALAFLPNHKNKPQVNHINGIKTDNRVENLEWCTGSENQRHAHKTGLNKNHGTTHYKSKLSESQVRQIYILRTTTPRVKLRELSRSFCVSMSCISLIASKKNWKHLL